MNNDCDVDIRLTAGLDADDEELDASTRQLRNELLALDVERVDLVTAGPAPEGAKAGDAVTWGALLVTLAGSGALLPVLVDSIRSWLLRHRDHKVVLQIDNARLEISDVSPEQQQRLIDSWLTAVGSR